jgi:tetratricopeptide (TPR) repeat protein
MDLHIKSVSTDLARHQEFPHLWLKRVGSLVLLLILASTLSCQRKSDSERATEALNRGLTAHVEGRIDEAAEAYREVLSIDPDNKYAHYNLGLIDHQAGRSDAAEVKYRMALSYDPDFVPALFNLAILRTAESPAEAEDLYRHVIEVQPDHATAHLNLGFLLISLGRQDEGQALIDQAILLDPTLESRRAPEPSSPQPSPEPRPSS